MKREKKIYSEPTSDTLLALRKKADWVWRETLKIHKNAQGTRLASSLSCIEIFVVLYYGGILNYYPCDIYSEKRDRLIISKAHGSISCYPILADLNFIDFKTLSSVGKAGSVLGDIPDCSVPGFEAVNGSLGHGLGVGCGMALALKKKGREEKVFVLSGDGELYEGSVWESIMFAGHHHLDNLILIIDNNKLCMLDYCANILDLEPISEKFKVFNWETVFVDGHCVKALHEALSFFKQESNNKPKVLIAETIKGKGVASLEKDSLSHVKSLKPEEIDLLLEEM